MKAKISSDEKRWQAEDDARSLKRYAELQSSPQRMKAAQSVIRKEIKQSQAVLGKVKPNK
jgi:hypothetical protein